ncbi:hypothetical protein VTJ49DRAFT_6296 [Mycothermus thermophilus]|uniref:BZIP domain-containing protein n=1 Tax=Humicola insolens TaxID=85995 RepID=A0ABR3V1P0_HUMIN
MVIQVFYEPPAAAFQTQHGQAFEAWINNPANLTIADAPGEQPQQVPDFDEARVVNNLHGEGATWDKNRSAHVTVQLSNLELRERQAYAEKRRGRKQCKRAAKKAAKEAVVAVAVGAGPVAPSLPLDATGLKRCLPGSLSSSTELPLDSSLGVFAGRTPPSPAPEAVRPAASVLATTINAVAPAGGCTVPVNAMRAVAQAQDTEAPSHRRSSK